MILLYDEKWLQEFDGNIDPNTVNFKELANSLEKYTSQYVYKYKTNIKNFNIIKIKIMNNNIPHLLGSSHNHHVGLPSYYSQAVFEGLKNDWTLEKIKTKLLVFYFYINLCIFKTVRFTQLLIQNPKIKD